MRLHRSAALAAAALGLACVSTGAQAQADSFRVEANSTLTTELTVCNPSVRVTLTGDGDTDLDFTITNARGDVVHSDFDYSDDTTAVLNRQSGRQCEDFVVQTTNLGNVWNMLDVAMETLETDSGNPIDTASYRAEANATHRVDLSICSPQVRVEVSGDGDTDLDFVIRDSYGQEVHSNYDYSDTTSTVLNRRGGVECEQFQLETVNLGDVYNLYQVQLEDVVQDGLVYGSGDGNNRDISIVNSTGQTIMYLYWSNVGAGGWGEDRLGTGVLAAGQNWNVTVDDGSGACRFDFKAQLADGREIEQRNIDVCAIYTLQFAGGSK